MSAYNSDKYIANAIASILAQSYPNFELIVINDGSTDQTLEIIKRFSDKRIHVLSHENRGLTHCLNEGISKARGYWIARQDADDISLYNRLELQMLYLTSNKEIQLLGSSAFVSNSRGIMNEILYYPCSYDDIRKAFKTVNPFVHGSIVIKRQLIEDMGGYNESYTYVQDYELWSRLLDKCRASNLHEPLYARYRHAGASESRIDKQAIFSEIRDNALRNQSGLNQTTTPLKYPISAANTYPIVGLPYPFMKWLAVSYMKIANVLSKNSLAAFKAFAYGILYCPYYGLQEFLKRPYLVYRKNCF